MLTVFRTSHAVIIRCQHGMLVVVVVIVQEVIGCPRRELDRNGRTLVVRFHANVAEPFRLGTLGVVRHAKRQGPAPVANSPR